MRTVILKLESILCDFYLYMYIVHIVTIRIMNHGYKYRQMIDADELFFYILFLNNRKKAFLLFIIYMIYFLVDLSGQGLFDFFLYNK